MNEGKAVHHRAHLVRLQMADEVPGGGGAQLRDFRQGFLHVVLAEVPQPSVERLAQAGGLNLLGRADQYNVGGVAARPGGGLLDSGGYRVDVFGNRGHGRRNGLPAGGLLVDYELLHEHDDEQ